MRLVFAGTPAFAERALAALADAGHEIPLVLTQPDRPAGRGLRAVPSPVKRLARELGVEVFQPESFKVPGAVERVAAAHADALVVAAYGLLLPQALLDACRHGALNIHASLLPRWRGAAPIQRAILAGDEATGITIMQMDAGLDTGPLLAQRALPIAHDEDAGSLHDRLAQLGAQMIVEALAEVEAGRARPAPQPQAGATYARKIARHETRLDWSQPASRLERAVRAFRPAPGAWTMLEGEVIKIWRARVVERELAPGTVADGLVVGCGEKALEVGELQRAGARRVTAAQFLGGRRSKAPLRFE